MKSAEYTIQRMTMKDHSDTSWEALFNCEDEDRRSYKLMYNGRVIDSELTFKQAQEQKAYYEAEDDFEACMDERYEQYPASFIKL